MNKMRTLSRKFIQIQAIFVLVVIGGSWLIYYLFADSYYAGIKIDKMNEAYNKVKLMNLSEITDIDETIINKYETMNFKFTIANKNFKKIYLTSARRGNKQVSEYITQNTSLYAEDASASFDKYDPNVTISLRGKIVQNNKTFYVYIRENVASAMSGFEYTNTFLFLVFIAAMIIGNLLLAYSTNKVSTSLKKINQAAFKISRRDFSSKVDEDSQYLEMHELAVSINDMSEQIETYVENLEEYNKVLKRENENKEHLDKMRRDFIGNVSHQLKTPIAVVSTQVEILQAMGDKVDTEYYYESLMDETRKMAAMVENLLKLMTIENDLTKITMEKMCISRLINALHMNYQMILEKKNIKLEWDIEEGIYVNASPMYIEQAVNNYIMNAYKNTDSGNKICVSLKTNYDNVQLQVFNEGENIAEEHLENIWKSFFTLSDADDSNNIIGGTGLGLYVVQQIVNMHEGECGVINMPDGVMFWIKLKKRDME